MSLASMKPLRILAASASAAAANCSVARRSGHPFRSRITPSASTKRKYQFLPPFFLNEAIATPWEKPAEAIGTRSGWDATRCRVWVQVPSVHAAVLDPLLDGL